MGRFCLAFRCFVTVAFALGMSGCGVTSPAIQESWGQQTDVNRIEGAVANEIECELSNGLKTIRDLTAKDTKLRQKYGFVFDWVAQVNYTFYVDEQSSFSPTLSFVNPTQILTLGLDASHKSEANRTDKVTLVYKVVNLMKGPRFDCAGRGPQPGSVFVTSDLHIGEWLIEALDLSVIQTDLPGGPPTYPRQAGAISHEVKFEVMTSGGVSPGWKLARFSGGGAPLVSAARDRYQDLLLTLGPPDKGNPDDLGPSGRASVLASQFNSVIQGAGRISP